MEEKPLSLQNFDILRQLGSGSFGKVELVQQKTSKQVYAMKSVAFSQLSQEEKDAALNEVKLLASINTPYVISYKGAFFHQSQKALSMLLQFAEGGDLQAKIVSLKDKETYFPEEEIWKLAYELFQGLESLHSHHIIHRDVKCANIFFAKGVAKLGDLNVSKFTEEGMCSTHTGTPYYTSPQIWQGEIYSNKCDIWSTGCVIYEACALKPPFQARDFPALYRRVTTGIYEDIPSRYSTDLKKLIGYCLTVDDQVRPSASQLLSMGKLKEISKLRKSQQNILCEIQEPMLPGSLQLDLKATDSRKDLKKSKTKKKTVNFAQKSVANKEREIRFRIKQNASVRSAKFISSIEKEDKVPAKFTSDKKKIKFPQIVEKTKLPFQKSGSIKFTTKAKKKFHTKKVQSSKCLPLPGELESDDQ